MEVFTYFTLWSAANARLHCAQKTILNAGYTSPTKRVPFMVSIQLLERHRDPQIFSVLETKDFCSVIPALCTKVGELLSHIQKMNTVFKKKKEIKTWWSNTAHRCHLLGFWGKRVQLLQWIISLTTATSVGGGGGTSPRPGIIGLIGVIPVIMLRPGSKPGTQIESVKYIRYHFGWWILDQFLWLLCCFPAKVIWLPAFYFLGISPWHKYSNTER